MKFSAITLFALQTICIASVGVHGGGDEDFWESYVDEVGSLPTPNPTPRPTPNPTPPPSPGPTPPPSPGPTPPPSPGPTPLPSPGPTPPPSPGPTPPPSPSPTPPPSPGPTPPPSPGPTPPPSPGPTPPPTPVPTPPPTLSPTGVCVVDADLKCTAVMDSVEIACEDIPQEDKLVCECAECVREVVFKYTGLGCSSGFASSGKCADEGPNPFIAGYRITDCEDATIVLATGEAQQGEYVTIGAADGTCLPACLDVTLSVSTGAVTQTFEIDSECGGKQGLILTSDYGAFESIGYSCSESDTHNCMQDVNYGVEVCNTGSTDETIYEWFLTINKEEIDLLVDIPPEDVNLSPGDCYFDTYEVEVDRCNALENCVNITANATNPLTGLPPDCSDEHEIKFGWDQPVTPPPTFPPR